MVKKMVKKMVITFKHDNKSLLEIASKIDSIHHLPTNPSGFWSDIAHVAQGNAMPACNCSLDPSESRW